MSEQNCHLTGSHISECPLSEKQVAYLEKYLSLLVDKERAVLTERVVGIERSVKVYEQERGGFVTERQHRDLTLRIEKVESKQSVSDGSRSTWVMLLIIINALIAILALYAAFKH